MVIRLKLILEQAEYSALLKSATAEFRNPTDQVHFILRQELERNGLLQKDTQTSVAKSKEQPSKAIASGNGGDLEQTTA